MALKLPSTINVLYSFTVNKESSVESLRKGLNSLGFGELWEELFRPGSPLAFLTAQGLRVAQPVLTAFTTQLGITELDSLAERLEGPEPAPHIESDHD
jgi:hypothetical protein